jgi:site-specific DNA recombinase
VDAEKAPIIKRIFELYGTGRYSLATLRTEILKDTGVRIARSYLEKILKNRFYIGQFNWQGIEYQGTHAPIIEATAFQRVQDVFTGLNKPKYRKHNFAFAGLLTCSHDGCTVTTEFHKNKYIYYRCSQGRGKCELPYMREQNVSDQLGDVLKNIYVPDEVVRMIVGSMQSDQDRVEIERVQQLNAINQRLATLRTRMDQMYEDKLVLCPGNT